MFFGLLLFACDFDCTVKKHLEAIQNRDFPAFVETITQGETISFILPNGNYTSDRESYLSMLEGWFETPGWRLKTKVVNQSVTSDMGFVLLLVSYDEDDRDGKPYHLDHYLLLIFQKEKGEWRLVHDQNTKTTLN